MRLLEEFRRFASETRPDQDATVAGYYASLASEGLRGEGIGDDMGVIVRANVKTVCERIDCGEARGQAIGDALLAMFLFGFRCGRNQAGFRS